mmetsp:Transcript_2931/g.6168  ORF Transcript_2931/g.6168 Transcript_2931/m.6168 type:complete len:86 (-) Transcript_2931:883-1140(-)
MSFVDCSGEAGVSDCDAALDGDLLAVDNVPPSDDSPLFLALSQRRSLPSALPSPGSLRLSARRSSNSHRRSPCSPRRSLTSARRS